MSRDSIDRIHPPSIPTGMVTFLFSDIEGSTTRWETFPEAMQSALRRHDALMHAAVVQNGGYVFKTVGDEFCTVFQSAGDAIAAAVAAQHAIAAEDWSAVGGLRVRMAIHTGVTDERDGDYYGRTVNRVARLLAAGYGGQILISSVSVDFADGALPAEITQRDLGRHRLKDLPEPEHIYQLVAAGLPEMFPPLRSIGGHPNNLPQQLSSLLGREQELNDLKGLLHDARTLTIVGAGGVGKTSVALQMGADVLDEYEDGVWLVELAPLTEGSLVARAIATAIGITESANRPVLDTLVAYFKNKAAVILLDNCEHVVASAAEAAITLAQGCPHVRVLATTRQVLGIPGERIYRMPSLSVPPESLALTVEQAATYGAIALFVERGRAQAPAFHLNDANVAVLANICRRLDGIPLALELAAARLRTLSVTQISDRLAERFRLLTGGSRTALPRQQTMRALIDWSYDLLAENERTLFQRLAAFAGGCTLDAAACVCADERLEEWDVVDLVTALADKSLVTLESFSGAEPRYRMLESTRQYALERLLGSGEREHLAHRHAQYFLDFARRSDQAWSEAQPKEWIAPLAAELDNLRTALVWSLSEGHDTLLGLSLLGALEAFWWDAQPIEGRHWIGEALPLILEVQAPRELAKFWLTAANVALTLRQQKTAREAAERALAAYRDIGDPIGTAVAQRCLGAALMNLGHVDEGEPLVAEALKAFRAAGNRRLIGLALRSLAFAPTLRGNIEQAAALYREALSVAQSLGDERGVQVVSANLAEVEFAGGKLDAALHYAREALAIARSRRDPIIVCGLLINICAYLIALERLEEARSTAHEAIDVAQEIESDLHLAIAVQHLGAVSAVRGDPARGAQLLGYSDVVYRSVDSAREPTEAREYEQAMSRISERIGADEASASLEEGRTLSRKQVLALAMLV